jgi:type II secretory pathway pseudopilin PulG
MRSLSNSLFNHRPVNKKVAGYSLLEIAIVMGVVGAIVGALFAAAGMTQHKVYINQASDELNLIGGNMHNLYAGRNTSYAALGSPPATAGAANFSSLTPTYIQQGIFPVEMLSPGPATDTAPCAGTIANNPLSTTAGSCGGAGTGSAQVALAGTASSGVQFVVRYTNIDADSCADLLVRNSLPGHETGLTQIIVSSGITYTNSAGQLPVTSIAASAACPRGATYSIDWYYNL